MTVPCCQFVSKHRSLYGTKPDFTDTDISMASDKNTMYIWKDVRSLHQQHRHTT